MTGPIPDGHIWHTLAVVDIATGVLMERRDCTPAAARKVLRNAARRNHQMISQLAVRIAADGDLR